MPHADDEPIDALSRGNADGASTSGSVLRPTRSHTGRSADRKRPVHPRRLRPSSDAPGGGQGGRPSHRTDHHRRCLRQRPTARQRRADPRHRSGRHALPLRRQHARNRLRLQRPGQLRVSRHGPSGAAAHRRRHRGLAGAGNPQRPPRASRSGVLWKRSRRARRHLRRPGPFRACPQCRRHRAPGRDQRLLLARALSGRATGAASSTHRCAGRRPIRPQPPPSPAWARCHARDGSGARSHCGCRREWRRWSAGTAG